MAPPNPILPDIRDSEAYAAVRRDESVLAPGVRAICARHGMGSVPAERFPDGSLPVYAVGDRFALKLFPPHYAAECDVEATVLQVVEGRIGIPTPKVEATGELDGWAYLLMSRLHGEPLVAAWPELTAAERTAVCAQLGEALAALHAIRDPRSERVRPDWTAFVAGQRAGAVERQRGLGLESRWLERIPEFLDAVPLDATPDALLHTEVMREHLLVERGGHGARLSGLFDFEPSMVGAPEYEFASVGIFVSAGDADALRALLLAYGYAAGEMDAAMSARFLAWLVLHRYSNLPWFLSRVPPPPSATTPADLAAHWFGT